MLHVANKLEDDELISKYKGQVRKQQAAMRDYLRQHPFLYRDYLRERYYDDPFNQAKAEIELRKQQKKKEKREISGRKFVKIEIYHKNNPEMRYDY